MSRLIVVLVALVALVIAAGAVYLMTADIPAPSQEVTKTISNDRFPQ